MAIRVFVYSLLFLSVLSVLLSSDTKSIEEKQEERPLLTFHDSTLYVIGKDGIESMVNSKKALRYKNRDVLLDGKLVSKVKNEPNLVDSVNANIILKIEDNLTFMNDVNYTRGDFITLKTDQLDYDLKRKIAKNTTSFKGNYHGDSLKGTNLYLDLNKSIIKAKKSHFKINMN